MRAFCVLAALALATPALADPLPSWNDTPAKARIIDFVKDVTTPGSKDFVPVADRIATFDNDGTLWTEEPAYFQLLYALDRLREKAKADPAILTDDVLKAAAAGDMKGMMAKGNEGLLEIVNLSHAGMSVDEFMADAYAWLTTATDTKTGLHYIDMTYQPMVELLSYLRDEGFTTYIVSGGGVHFIRAFAQEAYNIPPAQVVGSQGETRYEVVDGKPELMQEGGLTFLDDEAGKPVGIDRQIGKRPIFAAGNSDGDFQMLEYTTAGDGPRLGLIVHHTDAAREYAYDRQSSIGHLDKALDAAPAKGWLVVDMAKDWSRIWTGGK